MRYRFVWSITLALTVLGASTVTAATRTAAFKPSYVPPAELQLLLGTREAGGRMLIEWSNGGDLHSVEVRRNDTANLLLFTGASDDVTAIEEMSKAFDVAPRQISLEARIVEVDTDRARDLGIDWSYISTNANLTQDFFRTKFERWGSGFSEKFSTTDRQGRLGQSSNVSLGNALKLLEEKGAATTRDVPRILTLNNRPATILDGHRVTYVLRANSYTGQYVADTMDAGLKLEVTPSLVESGNMRLQLKAELTSLVNLYSSYSGNSYASLGGSPVKQGQIVENTIMARNGETIVLGGFVRTLDSHTTRRFPILGYILPWIFSRDIVKQSHHESIIAITPRVVDLNAGVDEETKKTLEGK